jgi:phage terminase large subunit GpA-like protein
MLELTDIGLLKGFLDGIRPERLITVSEWADNYRYLAPEASAEPGRWRTDRTPYLKEIQDRLSSSDPCQEVVVMKGAQLGFTECGNNWTGYVMDVSPGPMLMVMPTDGTVKRNSKIRIAPMIESTPRLRDKVATAKSRDGDNTTFSKSFPGGVLIMTGANSAVGLRSMPARFLFLDEVDGYPNDLDGEGSPIELAKARTRTFAKKKIFMISTPTVDGASAVQTEFADTDQRYFHVPCPHCGGMQDLKFSKLKWIEKDPETAKYQCEHCDELIDERHKGRMLAQGDWIAHAPENTTPRRYGYHLNSLYSPLGWYSWVDAAREFLDANKSNDTNKMKTFVNTVLGECYVEKGEAPDWQNIYNRRETYNQNKPATDVVLLTAGVDVQKDRLEVEIVGWCRGKRSYSIDYRVILGETTTKAPWDKLAELVGEKWLREDGGEMGLNLMAVDTGYNTSHVYEFCRRFDYTKVIPVKGSDSLGVIVANPKAVDTSRAGKKINRIKIWQVGVSVAKSELYGFLKTEKAEDGTAPDGYCHFPQYAQEYFRGITGEQLQFKLVRGFKRYEWVKKYERNEPLDCRVYARAAAAVLGMDRWNETQWAAMAGIYSTGAKTEAPKKRKTRESIWDR